MNTTRFALAAAVAAGLSGTAMAQSTNWVEVDDDAAVTALNMDADRLEDMDVYGSTNTKIGEVEDVIGSDAKSATALVVDFDDDAGYGDRDDVIVPLDQFSISGERLVLNADAAAVGGFETYKD